MNHEQRLQAITDLIADKELKFGCEVEFRMAWFDSPETIERSQIYSTNQYADGTKCFKMMNGLVGWESRILKVFGTPPDLTRVLGFLIESKYRPMLDEYGNLFVYGKDQREEYGSTQWNLSESLLKYQSEEVISFLYDLLITK